MRKIQPAPCIFCQIYPCECGDAYEYVADSKCAACGAANDVGELCEQCAVGNDPLKTDLEASGGWMVQAGRDRG